MASHELDPDLTLTLSFAHRCVSEDELSACKTAILQVRLRRPFIFSMRVSSSFLVIPQHAVPCLPPLMAELYACCIAAYCLQLFLLQHSVFVSASRWQARNATQYADSRRLGVTLTLQAISTLPEYVHVGLITFGTHVHVYELGFTECSKCYVFRGTKEYTTQVGTKFYRTHTFKQRADVGLVRGEQQGGCMRCFVGRMPNAC